MKNLTEYAIEQPVNLTPATVLHNFQQRVKGYVGDNASFIKEGADDDTSSAFAEAAVEHYQVSAEGHGNAQLNAEQAQAFHDTAKRWYLKEEGKELVQVTTEDDRHYEVDVEIPYADDTTVYTNDRQRLFPRLAARVAHDLFGHEGWVACSTSWAYGMQEHFEDWEDDWEGMYVDVSDAYQGSVTVRMRRDPDFE